MAKKGQTAKHRRQRKKEKANREAKKRTTLIVDEREPKEIIDKLKECPDIEVKTMSPARRAFQDV